MADQRPAAVQRLVHLRRRCVRRACSVETALPSALALRSTDSAADLSALFAGFIATMARSDFSPPYIAGVGSSPSRHGPLRHMANGSEMRSPRFRSDPFARDVALDPGRATAPSHSDAAHVAFGRMKTLGP